MDELSTEGDQTQLYRPRRFTALTRQRFFRERRAGWAEHVGGNPTRSLLILIDQAIGLEWDIRRLEDRHERLGKLSQHDKNELAAWRRHQREILRQLGPPAKARPPTLEEHLSRLAARNAERAAAAEAEEARRREAAS